MANTSPSVCATLNRALPDQTVSIHRETSGGSSFYSILLPVTPVRIRRMLSSSWYSLDIVKGSPDHLCLAGSLSMSNFVRNWLFLLTGITASKARRPPSSLPLLKIRNHRAPGVYGVNTTAPLVFPPFSKCRLEMEGQSHLHLKFSPFQIPPVQKL